MAGYLFQPERALYWLAKSPRGAIVGVEVEDDVVVKIRAGDSALTILEQLKKTSSTRTSFGDKSKDLWNTLHIWLSLIEGGEIDIETAQFNMVTNKDVQDNSIAHLFKTREVDEALVRLKAIEINPSKAIEEHAKYVLHPSRSALLRQLLGKIMVDDGTDSSGLRERILDEIHMPESLPHDDIYHALLGWIHEAIIELIKAKRPAIIRRNDFSERLNRLIVTHSRQGAIEKAAKLIPVSDEDKIAKFDAIFVRQLLLIAFKLEDNETLEAIEDFLRCESERVRLTTEGKVQREDFVEFDERLIKIWQRISNRLMREYPDIDKLSLESRGQKIYFETIGDNRCEKIAGHDTYHSYLTSGRFHYLSNDMYIGWHPRWKEFLKGEN